MTNTLTVGQRYTATSTAILNWERVYNEVGFTAARSEVEYVTVNGIDMVRVWAVKHPRHPEMVSERLYVAGSISENA